MCLQRKETDHWMVLGCRCFAEVCVCDHGQAAMLCPDLCANPGLSMREMHGLPC